MQIYTKKSTKAHCYIFVTTFKSYCHKKTTHISPPFLPHGAGASRPDPRPSTESRRLVPVINRGSQTAERAQTPATKSYHICQARAGRSVVSSPASHLPQHPLASSPSDLSHPHTPLTLSDTLPQGRGRLAPLHPPQRLP